MKIINITFLGLVVLLFTGCSSKKVEQATHERYFRVQVVEKRAMTIDRSLVAMGKTISSRNIVLKAPIAGKVIDIFAEKGSFLEEGDMIVSLEVSEKTAQLNQARALVEQKTLECASVKKLFESGYESSTRYAAAQGALEEALAKKANAEKLLSYAKIQAPFKGFLDTRVVEIGDYLNEGSIVGTFIDIDSLKIIIHVSSMDALRIRNGMKARVRVGRDTVEEGVVSYVSRDSDSVLRTYAIEVTIHNPGHRLSSGMNAEVEIFYDTVLAQAIPASALALNNEGIVGAKVVNDDNTVKWYAVEIFSSTEDTLFVMGLPSKIRLITVGQGFVEEGQIVTAVTEVIP